MKLVRIVSAKLGEAPDKTGLASQGEKHALVHRFLYNVLRASIKRLPLVGSFLHDVIYGTLDSQAPQKEAVPQRQVARSPTTFQEQKRQRKDEHGKEKWYRNRTIQAALIGLVGTILTILAIMYTSKPGNGGESADVKKVPAENKLPISLTEICKDIDSRPLVQQEETAKRYIGVNVRREHLKLLNISEDTTERTFTLALTLPGQTDVSYLTGRQIHCKVGREQYPELNGAQRGADLYVSGRIELTGQGYIHLADVSIEFE
jgi:hypothetical protein